VKEAPQNITSYDYARRQGTAAYEHGDPFAAIRYLEAATQPEALAALDANEVMDLVVEAARVLCAIQAERYRALAALAEHPTYGRAPIEKAAKAVARALGTSEHAAAAHIAEARTVTRLFPESLDRLASGDVQVAQVRALVEATRALDDETARTVQERVLRRMPDQTVEATRKALSRAVLKAESDGVQRRHPARM
jgi:hypothetical protein